MWMLDSGFEVLLILMLGGVVLLLKFVEQGPPEGWATSLQHARSAALVDDPVSRLSVAGVDAPPED